VKSACDRTQFGIPFTNSGAVDLQTAKVEFDGGVSSSGPWTVEAPATLAFAAGTANLNAGSTVSGDGTLFEEGSATVNLADAYSVAHTVFQGGTANFNGPSTTATLAMGLSNFGGTLGGSADFTVIGLLTWKGSAADRRF